MQNSLLGLTVEVLCRYVISALGIFLHIGTAMFLSLRWDGRRMGIISPLQTMMGMCEFGNAFDKRRFNFSSPTS
jgi:hypothetical protein